MKNENSLSLTPVLLPTSDASEIFIDVDNKELCYAENSALKTHAKYPCQYLYLTSARDMKKGDWAMFYSQPSKVLEINGGSAKIETHGIVSENDAETINSIKGEGTAKAGETCIMIHSFSLSRMQKIEFTTDPKLIADGVPALPEKAFMRMPNSSLQGKGHEVSFLPEFVSSYNNRNVKGVDVEKLATKYATNDGMMAYVFPEKKKAFSAGYSQALQSNTRMFSLEDMRLLWDFFIDGHHGLEGNPESFDEWLNQAKLTSKQGKIDMWCEMEEDSYVSNYSREGTVKYLKIKLNKDGQPIIYFN